MQTKKPQARVIIAKDRRRGANASSIRDRHRQLAGIGRAEGQLRAWLWVLRLPHALEPDHRKSTWNADRGNYGVNASQCIRIECVRVGLQYGNAEHIRVQRAVADYWRPRNRRPRAARILHVRPLARDGGVQHDEQHGSGVYGAPHQQWRLCDASRPRLVRHGHDRNRHQVMVH